MKSQGKKNTTIAKFLLSAAFALVVLMATTFTLSYEVDHAPSDESLVEPVLASTAGFVVSGLLFYGIIKALGVDKFLNSKASPRKAHNSNKSYFLHSSSIWPRRPPTSRSHLTNTRPC